MYIQRVLLVHAAHQEAVGYDSIVWGDTLNGIYGRASMALRCLSLDREAMLYVGCGALAEGSPIISHMVLAMMLARGQEVPGFEDFTPEEFKTFVSRHVYLDEVSQTTVEEIRAAGAFCAEHDAIRLDLVSSPTHIVRCLRDALAERECPGSTLRAVTIGIVASDTNFDASKAADVTIFEPPHRADRHRVPIHRAVKTLFRRMGSQADAERLEHVLWAIGDDEKYAAMQTAIGLS